MLNANVELFMSEYFLTKAVLGKYLEDSRKLFTCLSKIFLIPDDSVDSLYQLAENELAQRITSEQDFMQYQRMQKYLSLVGETVDTNAEWEEVARIKGNAMLIAQGYNLVLEADVTRNMVYNCLTSAATRGVVSALRIMGVLQCEGIFLDKNEKAGIKSLNKAANWNDSISALALVYYGVKRDFNVTRLRQVVENTPFAELYAMATERYGVTGGDNVVEVKLLNKACNAGILKRDTYDATYSHVLYSKAVSLKDKEKALFSSNKELISAIGDLPLKLSNENMVAVDVSALQYTVIARASERDSISRALTNADLRELSTYRPLCLCCESKYILNMYAKALNSADEDTHIELIDVAELSEYDFEPTLNNIFVRSIDEDRDNRLLLFFYGVINDRKMDAVRGILQGGRRAKFHLNSPGVTLNLSAVLPVCFCDKQNERLLKPYCDVIDLNPISSDEFELAIADILASKQKLYEVGVIRIEGNVSQIFGNSDIDTAEKAIDMAVRAKRIKGADITLTRELLQTYLSENNRLRIGFGGMPYEGR